MKLRVLRNSLHGNQAVYLCIGGLAGLGFAGLTMLAGAAGYRDPDIAVDALAALFAVWLAGWVIGPLVTGGGDETLRVEHFRLLPIPPARLASGLVGASMIGIPSLVTLIAFGALVPFGAHLGAAAVPVAVLFAGLQLLLVVLTARVVIAALGAMLTSRKGRDLAILAMALLGLSGVGVNYVAGSLGPALIEGRASGLAAVVRALPTGWGPVAVRAAAESRWPVVLAATGALVLLIGALLGLYALLLVRRSTTAPHSGRGGSTRRDRRSARILPATPLGAVAAKEVRTWWRDPRRRTALLSTVVVGLVIAVAPSIGSQGAGGASSTSMLPYLPLWVVGFACLQAGNLYGFDGSALWQTLTIPGAGRVDVRGRQLGWLLIVAPVALLLAVLVPGATSHLSAYPWVLGLTPALLGGGAGLLLLLSVFAAFPVPDQRLHANPFSIAGGRPGCAAWLLQLAMALLLALAALPVLAVLLTAHFTEVDSLRWAAIPVGIATGALLAWWWGRIAYLRLDARGPELLDLVRKGR